MTLIVAIQTKDSIIITTDKRHVSVDYQDFTKTNFHSDQCKLYTLNDGMLTGCGEYQIILRMSHYAQQEQNISLLPKYLQQLKEHRTTECGEYDQITNTKIIFSIKNEKRPQLYLLGFESEIEEAENNDIIILMPINHELLNISMNELQKLKLQLKEYNQFKNNQSWINHYLHLLSDIYTKQNQCDQKISPSFHMFLQSNSYNCLVHINNEY